MKIAKQEYWLDRDAYQRVFQVRDEKVKVGRPYWNTQFDNELIVKAVERTDEARGKGLRIPERINIFDLK